ncbi:hypothetical protein AB0K92_20445, partial [Streptomyces sp. NPDC052687]
MPDDTTARSGDFLDRLLARHAPMPRTGVTRVRPRLPGPFERIEAVRARDAGADGEDALVWPTATPSADPRDHDPARPAPAADPARLLIERERTVVRAEPQPDDSRPLPPPAPEPPPLRPAATVTP